MIHKAHDKGTFFKSNNMFYRVFFLLEKFIFNIFLTQSYLSILILSHILNIYVYYFLPFQSLFKKKYLLLIIISMHLFLKYLTINTYYRFQKNLNLTHKKNYYSMVIKYCFFLIFPNISSSLLSPLFVLGEILILVKYYNKQYWHHLLECIIFSVN